MSQLEPQVPSTTTCKCCDAPAALFDVCDFAKNCHDKGIPPDGLSGIPIYYYRCGQCGFLFTTQFDDFSKEDFLEQIYNDDYLRVDPDFVELRPKNTAKIINSLFGQYKEDLRILDYGGGNGLVEKLLKEAGFPNVETYDPYYPGNDKRPTGTFQLVFSVEVVEHSTTPMDTFQDMHSFLDPDESLLLFTTLIQPKEILQARSNWWYVGPRNGHCSIHTMKSLAICLHKLGLKYANQSPDLHLAFAQVPKFLATATSKGQ